MIKAKRILSILLILIAVISATGSSYAKNELDDAKKKKTSIQNKIKETERKIKELEKAKENTSQYISKLDQQLEQLDTQIEQLAYELEEKNKQIEITLKELDIAKDKENNQYEVAKQRIKFMYEKGNDAYIDVLFNSKNIADMLNRIDYIQKISEYDKNFLLELQSIKENIIAKEAQLETEYEELAQLNEEISLEKTTCEKVLTMKADELKKYENNIQSSEQLLKEYEEDYKQQEALIKKLEAASKLKYDGGKFTWPVPNRYTISSPFGDRYHPVYKVNKFHNGIDIPAPTGTKMVAAYNGTVVTATYSASAGNYLLIDHGDGYFTMYAHCSKFLVKEGQKVKKGDGVALVGNTGVSTGPHLHFAVRKGGNWVNPMQFFK